MFLPLGKLLLLLPVMSVTAIVSFNITEKQNHIRVKSIRCEMGSSKYVNRTYCRLKPTRRGPGLLTVLVWLQDDVKTSDFWLHHYVMYRFQFGFRGPLFVNWHIDWCKLVDFLDSPYPFLDAVFRNAYKNVPLIAHPCPYFGKVGIENSNINEVIEDTIPHIVPRGVYKGVFRFYRKSDNVTYLNFFSVFEVSAVDVIKNYRMGN